MVPLTRVCSKGGALGPPYKEMAPLSRVCSEGGAWVHHIEKQPHHLMFAARVGPGFTVLYSTPVLVVVAGLCVGEHGHWCGKIVSMSCMTWDQKKNGATVFVSTNTTLWSVCSHRAYKQPQVTAFSLSRLVAQTCTVV
jgi:hypothetical protein